MSESGVRSRRALLAGAAGGAAAIAANAALPASRALAVDQPLLLNVLNTPTTTTELTDDLGGLPLLVVHNTDAVDGDGIWAKSTAGAGLAGASGTAGTGVAGLSGDGSGAPSDTSRVGVFGYAEAGSGQTFGTGVWGVSDDIGVYGSGSSAVIGDGGTGGTGLEGYSTNGFGLYVTGRVKLSTRSGRLAVAKGKTSVGRNVTGMTAANIVIAVLQTSETGTWVRAAVAGPGKFTVYFNKALPTSSVVGWIVLD